MCRLQHVQMLCVIYKTVKTRIRREKNDWNDSHISYTQHIYLKNSEENLIHST